MTDLECKKICKVLNIKDVWLNVDNVVCVKTYENCIGNVYIYEDDFSNALPLRMLKLPSRQPSSPKKGLIELLLCQSEDGIRSAIVGLGLGFPGKTKLIDKNESLESLLVQYDLKFSCKKKACEKSRKKTVK